MSGLAAGVGVRYDPLKDKTYQSTRLGRDVADFLAWLELGGASPRTLDQYERDLAKGALMYPDADVQTLADGDAIHIARAYKPAERRVRVAAWKSFYKWALRTRRATVNPFDVLPTIKRPHQRVIPVFNDAEIEALLGLDVIDAAPLGVLLLAGLRKAEARKLRVRDCRENQIVVLSGKGSRDRLVPAETRLRVLLNDLVLLYGLSPNDHVFYSVHANQRARHVKRETPVGEGTFARWWARCLDDAGVSYRPPHTARHTFATRWRQRGLALDEIQILLGHSSIRTTSDLYVHTGVVDVAEHMAVIEARERETV